MFKRPKQNRRKSPRHNGALAGRRLRANPRALIPHSPPSHTHTTSPIPSTCLLPFTTVRCTGGSSCRCVYRERGILAVMCVADERGRVLASRPRRKYTTSIYVCCHFVAIPKALQKLSAASGRASMYLELPHIACMYVCVRLQYTAKGVALHVILKSKQTT